MDRFNDTRRFINIYNMIEGNNVRLKNYLYNFYYTFVNTTPEKSHDILVSFRSDFHIPMNHRPNKLILEQWKLYYNKYA